MIVKACDSNVWRNEGLLAPGVVRFTVVKEIYSWRRLLIFGDGHGMCHRSGHDDGGLGFDVY